MVAAQESLQPWWYWYDPHAEVRTTDPSKGTPRYYFYRPSPAQEAVLRASGWVFSGPSTYWTENPKDALEALSVPIPEWGGKHCYRVYWHEPVYYI